MNAWTLFTMMSKEIYFISPYMKELCYILKIRICWLLFWLISKHGAYDVIISKWIYGVQKRYITYNYNKLLMFNVLLCICTNLRF